MHQELTNSSVLIYFDWTVRILNHRSFCARLVRFYSVPDTFVNLKKLMDLTSTLL